MLKFNFIKELLALSAFFLCTGFDVFSSATVGNSSVPEPAKPVELSRYLGRWYELGSYPAPFQDGCLATHADYGLAQDGSIRVLNSCRKGSLSGKEEVAEGRAEVVEGSNHAKLKVSFFGPFYGDYWVLDHAPDYSWSIVGELPIPTMAPPDSGIMPPGDSGIMAPSCNGMIPPGRRVS